MNPLHQAIGLVTRRQFFAAGKNAAAAAALSQLFAETRVARGGTDTGEARRSGGLPSLPHFAPKAKRVVYLHMVGAPAQMEMYDHKPKMSDWYQRDLPESVRQGQRLTSMTSGQARFPIAPSKFRFTPHGKSGAWVSELLPRTATMVDDLCFIKSMHTEAINHEPGITYLQTGAQTAGRPSFGAWLAYGLGSESENLPRFVVLNASHSHPKANVQAISAKFWSAGFLPSEYAGVALRSAGDPVLFLTNPPGVDPALRRHYLDSLAALNEIQYAQSFDPETQARIAQYEMAFRMQSSVPDLVDLGNEPESTFALYGAEARKPGTFAHSCLLTRRMLEAGVRFVQVFHRGWDLHFYLPEVMPSQCRDIDQGCAALVQDLKQRGLLDDTLVLWASEFGRTIYSQGKLTADDYGRDHHPRCFTVWMAGGGVRAGYVHGETDDFSYNITRDPVHVRDLHATILHLLGIGHERFTFKHQGLDFRLTGVEPAHVVPELLA